MKGSIPNPDLLVGEVAVIRRHGKALPVVEDEFTDWWIHGIASQARPTALARRTKNRLPSAETLHTLASWSAGQPVPDDLREKVRQAYENLALYTEHTWGDHATDARKALPTSTPPLDPRCCPL